MKKYVCPVCGYVHEGNEPPEKCPQCGVPGSKFTVMEEGTALNFVCEHVIGVGAKDQVEADVYEGLKANFEGECTEVGMYIAMSRQAIREGYPEIGEFYMRAALEEAEHAAKFAELLGEVVTRQQRKILNLEQKLNVVQQQVNLNLQREQKNLAMTLFTTQFTKWQKTRQDTEKALKVC